jgi:hypothetical protein
MPRRGFLFVNKTAASESLSNSRGHDDVINHRLVAKHAQENAQRDEDVVGRVHTEECTNPAKEKPIGWHIKFRCHHQPSRRKRRRKPVQTERAVYERYGSRGTVVEQDKPLIQAAIDSCCSTVLSIGPTEHLYLEYCTKTWMPTSNTVVRGSRFRVFTKYWPGDSKASFHFVQGALQASDPLSLYAMLAASAQRMKYVDGIELGPHHPEKFMLKAIQALRARASCTENVITQRLVLDISCFLLYESYLTNVRRCLLYWKMIQDIITSLGGFQNLESFTALTVVIRDYLASVPTLEPCAIDPFRNPGLVGISTLDGDGWKTQECHNRVGRVLCTLDPRVQFSMLENCSFNDMLEALGDLKPEAVDKISKHMTREALNIYIHPMRPLEGFQGNPEQVEIQSEKMIYVDAGGEELQLPAYIMPTLARHKSVRVWLYFSLFAISRHDLSETNVDVSRDPSTIPESIMQDIVLMSQILCQLPSQVMRLGWQIRPDFLLWQNAVGALASWGDDLRFAFESEFHKLATEMGLSSRVLMEEALSLLFPLQVMKSEAMSKLWDIIKEGMLRSRGNFPSQH